MNNTSSAIWQTPVGWLGIAGTTAGIVEIILHVDPAAVLRSIGDRPVRQELLLAARTQIDEYFAGDRRAFDLPLVYPLSSPFRVRVLDCLRQVSFGATVTYAELARQAGHTGAARAVGGCMARNPFPLVVPCHRVVGAGGAMTGYSGGAGIASKEWLLRFEGELKRKSPFLQ